MSTRRSVKLVTHASRVVSSCWVGWQNGLRAQRPNLLPIFGQHRLLRGAALLLALLAAPTQETASRQLYACPMPCVLHGSQPDDPCRASQLAARWQAKIGDASTSPFLRSTGRPVRLRSPARHESQQKSPAPSDVPTSFPESLHPPRLRQDWEQDHVRFPARCRATLQSRRQRLGSWAFRLPGVAPHRLLQRFYTMKAQ